MEVTGPTWNTKTEHKMTRAAFMMPFQSRMMELIILCLKNAHKRRTSVSEQRLGSVLIALPPERHGQSIIQIWEEEFVWSNLLNKQQIFIKSVHGMELFSNHSQPLRFLLH